MTFYLSGAASYSIFLIYRMFQDRECSKTDALSWAVIAIASLFWIVVIPISIIEIKSKTKAKDTFEQTPTAKQNENDSEGNNSPVTDY